LRPLRGLLPLLQDEGLPAFASGSCRLCRGLVARAADCFHPSRLLTSRRLPWLPRACLCRLFRCLRVHRVPPRVSFAFCRGAFVLRFDMAALCEPGACGSL